MSGVKPNLSVNVGGILMKNPVTTASGTFGFGPEYSPYLDLNRLGAIVVKGITLLPRTGNPTPRLAETPAGILNSIGLQNPGVERFISEALPFLADYDLPVIVNIAGDTVDDYALLAEKLSRASGVGGLEVNISCPNVKKGGMQFGSDPAMAAEVTRAVKASTGLPVIVKLSPNVTSIVAVAEKVAEAGADALSMINTVLGMAIDIKKKRPVLGNLLGGLSGPAVKPVAVRAVWQVYREVKLPIIGMGGITTAEDAIEFILAGATAVAVGTANFVNPRATMDVLEGIENYLCENGIENIDELTGLAQKS
ncbi:dihydroorotate dehydrogenase [Pelotomaculum terephthalicicum JT]|uniref:dihydroorotate dehydrogenase n=1 Tax=Pelotomaculum TaxID=191373 RepID=UPI0009CDB2E2|nr:MULTISPECIES: dihydroorotate dehydrogenase [Pelotomaculum]MCG9967609.1 dihydroorotate dehydrogenase [Pelotomaculum terephthalicicum JT]OPX91658.1 MAG: Dihydroorotate dehydrogenase B (NAD(+)), catalytic subunit [Pelotomaculum sp. PtaB.Bin117]OPY61840.1 MAG: Dihydroorotate dehydrogenase B (NAD(+)), catalytic subunit [Pelotomaculum sp. PtaU1.Bin065]